MQGIFLDEFKLSYGYAVTQPFPTRALLLQVEDGGEMDGVRVCGQHRGVDTLGYCSAIVD